MYDTLHISKYHLSGYYGFYDRWRISIEEIEDIFLESIDDGYIFDILDPLKKDKIKEINFLQPIEIHMAHKSKSIDNKTMQKFITRLEYLNLKIEKIIGEKYDVVGSHVIIKCIL